MFRDAPKSPAVFPRRWAAAACALAGLSWAAPSAASGVVGLTAIEPPDAAVEVERLGSVESEAAAVGGDPLLPGDLLSCLTLGVAVELTCPPDSANTYSLESPFRVMIDVPAETECHVDLLTGDVDVLTEDGTEVTAGGVELKSVSTQYAVRVRRVAQGVERLFNVYEGKVQVRSRDWEGLVGRSRSLYLDPELARTEIDLPSEEISRSAMVYSRLEVAKAQLPVAQRAAARQELATLYAQVLASPEDQDRRLELAKTQLRYEVTDKAVLHLRKAEEIDPERFQTYDVDWSQVQWKQVAPSQQEYLSGKWPGVLVEGPAVDPGRMLVAIDPTDLDLARIERGEIELALESLEQRVREQRARSRDYYAMARAYSTAGDAHRAAAAARRALALHETDGELSDREAYWVKAVLEGSGG